MRFLIQSVAALLIVLAPARAWATAPTDKEVCLTRWEQEDPAYDRTIPACIRIGQSVLEILEERADAYARAGGDYESLGDLPNAALYVRKALALNPASSYVQEILWRIERAAPK